jgi:hypothetical protein
MDLDAEEDGLPAVRRGMMGRDSGIKIIRKPPPKVG